MQYIIILCAFANPADCTQLMRPSDAIGIIDCQKSAASYAASMQESMSRYRVEKITCATDPQSLGIVTGSITPRPFGRNRQ